MSTPALPRSGVSAERRNLIPEMAALSRAAATMAGRCLPAQWSLQPLALCLFSLLLCSAVVADETATTNTFHFRAVDIFVDSGTKPLAAYQLEFTASGSAKIVGIEGGESAAFKEPPFYDPKAIQQERVILGAFSTAPAEELPKGKTRVATIHLRSMNDKAPRYEVQLTTAATAGGRKISAQANANERQRNENQKASGQE